MSEKLRNWIKMHRARLDMTQEQLAEAVGCTRQTIISIEKYRYTPSVELALKIARVLGMTVDELFEFEEENGK
ncbi:transcriptional regulator [bacterium]|nr:MAG: transcriptional regulator [bacterium]